jgi:hypothetical protein
LKDEITQVVIPLSKPVAPTYTFSPSRTRNNLAIKTSSRRHAKTSHASLPKSDVYDFWWITQQAGSGAIFRTFLPCIPTYPRPDAELIPDLQRERVRAIAPKYGLDPERLGRSAGDDVTIVLHLERVLALG